MKAFLLFLAVLGLCFLPGCAGDQAASAGNRAASQYEDACVTQHMQVHKVEQDSLYAAQAADLNFKTQLNVNGAVAAATANPKITPQMLAADISRSYQEQQIMLNQVNANISNLQQQIAQINAYHLAAQKISGAVSDYLATPSVTATGVATAAAQALATAIPPKTQVSTSATIIATPQPSTPTATVTGTVALPVPAVGQ